ncbi:MAG: hypothetical protein ABI729_02305 [Chitinophagales bacterium]
MKKYLAVSVIVVFLFSSCFVQRYPVNDGPSGKGNYHLVDNAKQSWLFWGLMPLKSPDLKLPTDKNYQIETRYNVADYIVTAITFGIYGRSTVRIYSKQ